ncbi:MAG TPA: c-type cytochrome [Thermoanaerobaculia bacterium]|nr:c-type cytochrome [Thermoanaerobaculia bacterium]
MKRTPRKWAAVRRALPAAVLLALPLVLVPGLVLLSPAPSRAQAAPEPDLGSEEQRAAGKVVYDKWCAQCHGDSGAGDGIAAPYLHPAPRDFTSGKYKFRSTPFGALPTDEDLRRAIREGLPYTGMPPFPLLSDDEVTDVVYYLKTFSDSFGNPAAYAETIPIPDPPPFDAEAAAEEGFQTYVEIGCARCHGEEGRGDGSAAPTLRDDWGHFVRAADLTRPWTFRGGSSREAIFRTLSTGINGTPMAGFHDSLTEEQRWRIVDWIVAKSGGKTGDAPYARLVEAKAVDGGIDLADAERMAELFAGAKPALFPVVGQIMEPGRAFHPAATAVEVRAVYDRDDVAFLVSWHDMAAETGGENRPDLTVEEEAEEAQEAAADGERSEAAEPELDVWGNPVAPAGEPSGDPAGAAPADDFWGTGGGDPFATAEDASAVPPSPWSDAVALQFPAELREGVAKPYFLFGDASYPVELWHLDLARPDEPTVWEGRGSQALTLLDSDPPEVTARFDKGQWRVVFKRPRQPTGAIGFPEDTFVPLAVSVWDGFHEERGNKRGLTAWYHVHVPPLEQPSPVGPMVRAGATVLALELLVVWWVRRRTRRAQDGAQGTHSGEQVPSQVTS